MYLHENKICLDLPCCFALLLGLFFFVEDSGVVDDDILRGLFWNLKSLNYICVFDYSLEIDDKLLSNTYMNFTTFQDVCLPLSNLTFIFYRFLHEISSHFNLLYIPVYIYMYVCMYMFFSCKAIKMIHSK